MSGWQAVSSTQTATYSGTATNGTDGTALVITLKANGHDRRPRRRRPGWRRAGIRAGACRACRRRQQFQPAYPVAGAVRRGHRHRGSSPAGAGTAPRPATETDPLPGMRRRDRTAGQPCISRCPRRRYPKPLGQPPDRRCSPGSPFGTAPCGARPPRPRSPPAPSRTSRSFQIASAGSAASGCQSWSPPPGSHRGPREPLPRQAPPPRSTRHRGHGHRSGRGFSPARPPQAPGRPLPAGHRTAPVHADQRPAPATSAACTSPQPVTAQIAVAGIPAGAGTAAAAASTGGLAGIPAAPGPLRSQPRRLAVRPGIPAARAAPRHRESSPVSPSAGTATATGTAPAPAPAASILGHRRGHAQSPRPGATASPAGIPAATDRPAAEGSSGHLAGARRRLCDGTPPGSHDRRAGRVRPGRRRRQRAQCRHPGGAAHGRHPGGAPAATATPGGQP
jgi:hypothetical protein